MDRVALVAGAKKILAVHSGALGDVLLFGRLVSWLDGEVTLVAGGEKGKLLAGLGVVERAMDFDLLPMHEIFIDDDLAECRLPQMLGQCDRLISCFGLGNRTAELRLAAMCAAADAAYLPIRPQPDAPCHLLDLWCDMLDVSPPAEALAPWALPENWRSTARQELDSAGVAAEPFVVIHPGAGGEGKRWPLENFVALAERLDCPAVFVLGPVEAEQWDAKKRETLAAWPTIVAPSLEVLAAVLGQARAFIGNDSGPAHLAASLGTATLAIFGPTSEKQFAPRGKNVRTIQAAAIEMLAVEGVLREVEKLPT